MDSSKPERISKPWPPLHYDKALGGLTWLCLVVTRSQGILVQPTWLPLFILITFSINWHELPEMQL